METIKACIASVYMDNIHPDVVKRQREVVETYNRSGYPFYQIKTPMRHPDTMDYIWHMMGHPFRNEMLEVKKTMDYDVVLFLDIDALPVTDDAIDSYIYQAYNGILVGNIQRTNHIENGQHVFVAPSAMAISGEMFDKLGRPYAQETARSDVAEEYTWLAESLNIPVKMYLPLSFEEAAPEGAWKLKDGMPGFGRGTTFGDENGPTFWHNFQSFHKGQHERFMRKCKELLED